MDEILGTHSIEAVKIPPRSPRANAYVERFVLTARTGVTDRMLIFGERHLRLVLAEYAAHYNGRQLYCSREPRLLRQYETHHNHHRPHRSLHGAAPLKPLPKPVNLDLYRVRKQAQVGGMINEYRLVA